MKWSNVNNTLQVFVSYVTGNGWVFPICNFFQAQNWEKNTNIKIRKLGKEYENEF